MLAGLNPQNATPGNAVKAAILSTMFNLKLGSEPLDEQGYPRTDLVLSGGLTKTPELGQILADVFNAQVTLLDSAEEGTAWGAALMAKYRHAIIAGDTMTWAQFLDEQSGDKRQFSPNQENVGRYASVYERYKKLIDGHTTLDSAISA